ncbi:hypothetical protein ABE073_17830 [Lederbergia citrisecunda]|uniref:hypothetical protein n=1 Tax=Lederbergia citrisecunda TaxID=2833583 RepID=UPI003D2E0113
MKLPETNFRKVLSICAVLLLSIALGAGMNKALAGQNIQSLLTSWFDSKRDASINQIDEAITSEKERLMEELREAIRMEMQQSDAELAQFTADETALRLSMLQEYAANLIGGLHIDLTAEKAEIIANLDAALAEAMAYLDSSIIVPPPPISPPAAGGEGTIPDGVAPEESIESDGSNGEESEGAGETEDGTIEVDEEQELEEESGPDADTDEESEIPLEDVESKDEIRDTPEEDGSNEEEENTIDEELVSEEVPTNL